MVGTYGQSGGSLELRQPAKLFVPLAWLIAGPANPLTYFAFQIMGQRFDLTNWVICLVIPLSIACAAALFFLRGGGFGIVTLVLITALVGIASCAATGPIYTFAIWGLMQMDIFILDMPLWSTEAAVRTSGTFIALGLMLVAVCIVPAALILRIIAFRREAKKPRLSASAAGIL
jgi:hypothetical protein